MRYAPAKRPDNNAARRAAPPNPLSGGPRVLAKKRAPCLPRGLSRAGRELFFFFASASGARAGERCGKEFSLPRSSFRTHHVLLIRRRWVLLVCVVGRLVRRFFIALDFFGKARPIGRGLCIYVIAQSETRQNRSIYKKNGFKTIFVAHARLSRFFRTF